MLGFYCRWLRSSDNGDYLLLPPVVDVACADRGLGWRQDIMVWPNEPHNAGDHEQRPYTNHLAGRAHGIRNPVNIKTQLIFSRITKMLLAPQGALHFVQTASALRMICLLVSPFRVTILCGTIFLAWLFPLSREQYARIQRLLEERRARLAE